jgi:predicted outer membrane repeat protein
MNSQRCLRQSSWYSLPLVLLVALLTTPVMARNEGSTIEEPAEAQPHADPALQTFVVGDGTPASCTKDAIQYELWAALAVGGGRVFFNCGPDPVTIPIDSGSSGQPLSFFDNTTIDGGGRITLQAQLDNGPSLAVDRDARVLMKNLTIVRSHTLSPGVDNKGKLTVWECAFSNFAGPAILSQGSLTIIQSTFSNNVSALGVSSVVIQSGTGSVRRSTFSNSSIPGSGGAITNRGTLDIASSRFIGNQAEDGGAIVNAGVLTIENSEFTGNRATGAGAVLNEGSLTVTNTTFAGNTSHNPSGGAIFSNGTIVIRNCDFLNNGSAFGGALLVSGQVKVLDSTFSGNRASRGGAIYTTADPLIIRRSIILTNTAADGGGIFVAAGSLVQDNNTFIANVPNDIGSAAASTSIAGPSSTVYPEAWSTWLRSHVLFSLTASPQEIAARRAGPQTQQQ